MKRLRIMNVGERKRAKFFLFFFKAQENLRFSARCKYDSVYLSIHYSILSKIKSLRLKKI
jgi:hypothetical protein